MDLYKPERVTGTYYYKQKYERLKKQKAEKIEQETDYTPDIVDPLERAKRIIKESKKSETPLSDFTLNEKMLKKYTQNFKKY